ncbi:MAG: aldo/keto reductase [Nitrososphaerales archaeon]
MDLYMVHHPDDQVRIESTMAGMDDLVRRGLVRYVAVSNFSTERLIAAGIGCRRCRWNGFTGPWPKTL